MTVPRSMRVLVLAAHPDQCESALFVELARAGVALEVLCHPASKAMASLSGQGVPVAPIEFRGRFDPRTVRELRRRFRTGRYDVVHSLHNHAISNALLASIFLPVRHVAYRGTMGHLSRWDPASWLSYLNPRIRRIVCVSEAVRQYLLGLGLPAQRPVTIHKGHDPAWYAGLQAPPLRELGIPDGAVAAGFSGNMRPVKGVDVLLRAMTELADVPDLHLLLVGEIRDTHIPPLAANPAIRSRLHFAGQRQDAVALMGRCDIFVMPSVSREGLPKAAIEAMAQGVPCISSDVGGLPELVQDGVSGLVVPARNPAALAGALRKLAQDAGLRREMGLQARQRIQTAFHIQTTVRRTLELYREVMLES